MSSKLGLILSLIFVSMFFLLGVDLINIQFIYSDLDAKSIPISYEIAKTGRTDLVYLSYLENQYNVKFEGVSSTSPQFGDVVQYVILRDYKPIIISSDFMSLRVKRSAVIGYFG